MRAPLRLLFVLLVLAFVTAPPFLTTAAAAACHWGSSCPMGSYGAWTAYVNCDAPLCEEDPFCEAKGTLARFQHRERYRVHHYSDGSQCTEYQINLFRACGCS